MTGRLVFKDLPALPALSTSPAGEIRALVNTTGVLDSQQDRVQPGAWARVIESGKLPKLLISHDWDALPVGKVTKLEEWRPGDSRLPRWHQENGAGGLVMTAQANLATQTGRELYDSVAGGFVSEYSVGFIPSETGVRYAADGRHIFDIDQLPEISAVLMGASPETATLGVKGRQFFPPRRNMRLPQPAWLRACEPAVRRLVAAEVERERARRSIFAAIEDGTVSPWQQARKQQAT
jgi:HK97 family phage prohead protease